MTRIPTNLGNHLLIAMGNTPASLSMIQTVAKQLPDLAQIKITLMHYLAPIFWDHGSDHTPEALAEIQREKEGWTTKESAAEETAQTYFDLAQSILKKAGVPPNHIETKLCWEGNDPCDAIEQELARGHYSTVVVGHHHHGLLARLFRLSLADMLQKHTTDVPIWVIEDEPD